MNEKAEEVGKLEQKVAEQRAYIDLLVKAGRRDHEALENLKAEIFDQTKNQSDVALAYRRAEVAHQQELCQIRERLHEEVAERLPNPSPFVGPGFDDNPVQQAVRAFHNAIDAALPFDE